ncbi:alpha/beta fold hydrolase [Pseudonocardia acaciae]|uniref:alpha/beta fold hydrolase n=1 Tax=Pseudonocardia acaciae TaxID=551276 RepID=UPI00048EA759|nr:alpha/beta fold hydrolase [Pseudonocardia acaciae]
MSSFTTRLRLTRGRVATILAVLALLAGTVTVLAVRGTGPADVSTQDLRLTVPGGPGQPATVALDATLYLPSRTPAPSVLVPHGFGGTKASVDADARELAARGFVALAWSARGFGTSTGQIALDSPDHEVADASRLLDYLATRPEVRLDGPGDPRVGVTGASYGGALALLLAGYDHRVDAIAPVITWNDLSQALFPNAALPAPAPAALTPAATAFGPDGVFKRSWAGIFFSAGLNTGRTNRGPTGIAPEATPGGGRSTSAQAQDEAADAEQREAVLSSDPSRRDAAANPPTVCGRFVPAICTAYAEAASTGRVSPATAELLRRSSPASVTDRIAAPTLLVQGETDTLFGLDQADATARQIAAAGGTVDVIWFAGGHDGGAPGPVVRERIGAWFDRYLDGRTDAEATPGLSYAVQGGVRTESRNTPTVRTVSSDRYPGLTGPDPAPAQPLPLRGDPRVVLNPAGANPAAITSVPGVGGALGSLSGRLAAITSELPGQSAGFSTDPLNGQLLIAGSPRVRIQVAPVPGQPAGSEAVLFGKVFKVAQDGRRTLLGGAVAPMRVPMPADGSPAQVTVTLPAVVAPIEAGQRLVVSVSTTDQAYAGANQPSVWRIGLAGGAGEVAVPVVPGRNVTANTVPAAPAVGIGLILAAALVAWLVAVLRRRRRRAAEVRALTGSELPLVIDRLRKSYPGGVTAVNGVSFTARPNQVLGLLGPNGAGKTTVLRMLMGLIHPSAERSASGTSISTGEIRVFGHPVGPGAPVLSRIGSFVEGPGFLPHLSGADNLRLYWAATGRPAADAHVEEALEIAGLGNAVHRRVRTYSQGMRQRLAIAQAMLGLPDLLVLDEPTNGLDPPQIHAMREVLRNYARDGRTVLISSHLLAEVEQTCDHVVVMHRGTVVADGTVADIIAGGSQASFRVDDPARAAEVLRGASGVSAVEVDSGSVHADLNGMPRADAVGRLVQAGVAVSAAGPRRRLEDAFLQLVGEDTTP